MTQLQYDGDAAKNMPAETLTAAHLPALRKDQFWKIEAVERRANGCEGFYLKAVLYEELPLDILSRIMRDLGAGIPVPTKRLGDAFSPSAGLSIENAQAACAAVLVEIEKQNREVANAAAFTGTFRQ